MESFEISPCDAHAMLQNEGKAVLVDVREPTEFSLAKIDESELIPMQYVPAQLQRLEELADESTLLILCHHGVRSMQVVAWLREHGVENCYSVAGGIDRWSLEVDSAVPRY